MVGAACCIPAPPSEYTCLGKEDCWEGIDVYVNHPEGSSAAVVLVSDVFGWKAPLLRKLADKVAAAGFVAVVPDLLYGDPYDPVKFPIIEAWAPTWIPNHPPDLKPVDDSRKLIGVLHSKGITSIGFSGFCWGAKVATTIGKQSDCNAVVLCHPSLISVDDIKGCEAPIAILAAEVDQTCPIEMIKEFKEYLEKAEKAHFVKVYPTSHGWTTRYDVKDASSVKRAEEAHEDFIAWFHKYL